MTRSGQGDETQHSGGAPGAGSAALPAHEGVVLPADGNGPWIPGTGGEQPAPTGGAAWGAPWGPGQGQPQPPGVPSGPEPGTHPQTRPQQPYGADVAATQYIPPVPSAGAGGADVAATQYIPPVPSAGAGGADVAATQYIPPVPSAGAGGADVAATQYIPPVPSAGAGGADVAATQYIPPVPGVPGPLPPEAPAESTQYLGLRPRANAPAQTPTSAPATGDAAATQFLPPVPQRQTAPPPPAGGPYGASPGTPAGPQPQPPAGFENLFRSDSPPPQTPRSATGQQRHPLYAATPQHPQHSYPTGPTGPYGPTGHPDHSGHPGYDEPQARRSSRLPLIAAVVVGCAVVGLGVSALVFGGEDDKGTDKTPVAAASTPEAAAPTKAAAADDPAKAQAEELDKLLADSNDSRAAVIRSVESIKRCDNLDQAASDLRAAAEQRRSLVTRLKDVEVDKLQNHERLTESLTEAWEASASADDHYAQWAKDVDGKKGCRDGKARQSKNAMLGNRESGEATAAKHEASGLWNAIATKYSLTKRAATQL
ncbi:hypothetical protein V1460_03630 [Streptomyces sp. SCSIO 30461]|uniref:hypothetical protein n=1 Tax=Streptomyces sp. SCSIO 30461 TaxID=3118085 RepID=UPI0030D2FC59